MIKLIDELIKKRTENSELFRKNDEYEKEQNRASEAYKNLSLATKTKEQVVADLQYLMARVHTLKILSGDWKNKGLHPIIKEVKPRVLLFQPLTDYNIIKLVDGELVGDFTWVNKGRGTGSYPNYLHPFNHHFYFYPFNFDKKPYYFDFIIKDRAKVNYFQGHEEVDNLLVNSYGNSWGTRITFTEVKREAIPSSDLVKVGYKLDRAWF